MLISSPGPAKRNTRFQNGALASTATLPLTSGGQKGAVAIFGRLNFKRGLRCYSGSGKRPWGSTVSMRPPWAAVCSPGMPGMGPKKGFRQDPNAMPDFMGMGGAGGKEKKKGGKGPWGKGYF